MHDALPSWEYRRAWIAVLMAALLPLAALSLFAAPQTDDFCYGAIAWHEGVAGIWRHYQQWSGRLVASILIPLPTVLSRLLQLDLFVVYGFFALSFMLSFGVLGYWLIGQLLPGVANPSRVFFALALFIALAANAPTTRQMLFWMPAVFTYSLPAVAMLSLFMLLYRALADETWLSGRQFLTFVPALFLAALSNELTGPIAVLMLALSLWSRRRLRFAQVQSPSHAILIAAALAGTLIVYLAPGNQVREATLPDRAGLLGALLWGTLDVPGFIVLHLPRPGVLGWFLLLALTIAQDPPPAADRQRRRVLVGFALTTILGACWLAFVAGEWSQGHRLPDRAQNCLFFLGILGLSCVLSLLLRTHGGRPLAWIRTQLAQPLRARRLRLAGVALLLSSPAVLGAFWDLPQAPAFRRETRAQLLEISSNPLPACRVRQVETRPRLLFNNQLSPDGGEWPNRCLARYFRKQAIIPRP